MKELIRLDALVAMRGQHPVGIKKKFDPPFSVNASKNTAFFFKCLILSDVITQSQQ